MKKVVSLVLLVMLLIPSFAMGEGSLTVFNWEDYIDESVIEQFEQETGIDVNYVRFTTNEDMMVQVEANPGHFDLCFPSEYIVERMLNKDMLAEINYDNIPNAKYILENLQNSTYDPGNAHSVPYMWGTVGILYNTKMVSDPVDSWAILWNEKYQKNVFMLDSYRDSMGVALASLGYSMNTEDIVALELAKEKLIDQKRIGTLKAYQVDETKDKMVAGEAALAVMWSGDALYAMDLNEDLAYAVPQEGSNVWVDCMVIPKNARNKENAEKFIDFLCRPDIAQKNCEYIWYSSPNSGAIDLMGEDYINNTTINPTEETLARCEFFRDISEIYRPIYETLWLEVKSAK
ncbi:MAG: spermidine/putrescine ABC transporter substrate-binding protein [Clostridia bacterium]|nr:spermidine/putrescine ABC transporter substrate-binding protein [Clostridia bacterium]